MPALRTRDTQSRSTLEVSTDALHPPTLAIISPTPRAFTFPIAHNLTDSPYSSPSQSPFEPDLRSLALSSTPPPFGQRTCTPESSSFRPLSSSPSSHKRRKSCSGDIVERRPKKGDEDYIKRPENAFILFRRKCCEDRQAAQEEAPADGPAAKKQRQADLSKTISQQWKSLSIEERQYWENLAKEKKKEHEALYPNYVYRPQRARDKDGRPKARKSRRKSDDDTDTDSLSFVVPVLAPHQRHHGRSASAPTPPPYQSIQVPNVYQMTPSCPTSPSLLPMISRRSSHPDHSDEAMVFDYHPNEGYPQASSFGHLEASLQSSEFLQGMFNMAGMPTTRDSLHPLDLSPSSMLLPMQQIVSPSSSVSSSMSSGPSTPPIDPVLLAQDFSQLSAPSVDLDLDLQMEMQLQHEYAQFSWNSPADSSCAWGNSSELLLGTNDFDLGAIPPIELDVSRCQTEMPMVLGNGMEMDYAAAAAASQQCSQELEYVSVPSLDPAEFTEQGVVAFDQMMAGHGF